MFKLMRNVLKRFGFLVDEAGQFISWKYLEELLKLQTETGVRAANKLTQRHINFENQKMKVKLCTQVFSNSVSVSLKVCRRLQIPEFLGSEATSDFLALMDRLFDCLNSKPRGGGFKAPLRQSNRKFWKPLFDKVTQCLLVLKYRTKTGKLALVYKSKFGTFIRGLIISIKSLEMIMDDIVADKDSDLEYLPAYKLSQDLLEMFFSVLRSRYGFNNNPNVLQLEHGLKSILCCNLKPSLNGNAIPQDCTTTRISALGSIVALRNPSETFQVEEDEVVCPPLSCVLTSFVSNVVTYIAGFVGRALVRKQTCSSCLLALTNTDISVRKRSDFVLLNEKDNGGLFVPNENLVEICRITEMEIRSAIPYGVSSICKKNLVNRVLRYCNNETIFKTLRIENTDEHGIFSDHVIVLVRSIVENYLKIRLHHLSKEMTRNICPTTNRNICTKSIHFQGN